MASTEQKKLFLQLFVEDSHTWESKQIILAALWIHVLIRCSERPSAADQPHTVSEINAFCVWLQSLNWIREQKWNVGTYRLDAERGDATSGCMTCYLCAKVFPLFYTYFDGFISFMLDILVENRNGAAKCDRYPYLIFKLQFLCCCFGEGVLGCFFIHIFFRKPLQASLSLENNKITKRFPIYFHPHALSKLHEIYHPLYLANETNNKANSQARSGI